MPESEDPFDGLIGLWVDQVVFGSSDGQIVFRTDDQLDEADPTHMRRVRFYGISFSRWDREGMEWMVVSDTVSVFGRLEQVQRSGDTWTLIGGFGEVQFTATDVRRHDLDWSRERRAVPDVDVELPHACEALVEAWAEEDDAMLYVPQLREFGYRYVVGDSSYHVIDFCPFCGAELPLGLREEWFNRVRALGLDPFDDELPAPLQSDRWWREADFDTTPPAPDVGSARRLSPI